MAVAEELVAVLGYRVEGSDKAARWKKGIDDTEQSARRTADSIKRIGIAAGAATTAGIALATKGVKDYAKFERQIGRIGITANASVEETVKAGQTLQNLADRFVMPLDQAREGLDTLVSSGMSLKEALDFLPSVLMTAQAAGAATEDIANTAQKTASAFGLQASEMQKAFDIMVTGGKAGQFELKDMAQQIPSLASQFASLGYKGEDGLKRLIALLQTLRTQTGTAGAAATQAQNIFGKMFSQQTAKNFKKFGIDLTSELAKAKKEGKDLIEVFVSLTEKALKGDMTKIGRLFEDQEFRLGVTTLIQARDEWKAFLNDVNSSEVDGSTLRDFKRIADDTEASIQKLGNSYDRFMKALGGTLAPPTVSVLNNVTSGLEDARKADAIRAARGESRTSRFLNYGPMSESLIAEENEKGWTAPPLLRAPDKPLKPTKTPFGLGGFTIRKYGPVEPGQTAAQTIDQSLNDISAKATLDVSSFLDPANQARAVMMDLQTGVNARATLDISDIISKVGEAEAAMNRLRGFSSVGVSSGSPTPARVVGAGAAP